MHEMYISSLAVAHVEVIYLSFPAQAHLLAELIRQSLSEHIVCCQKI